MARKITMKGDQAQYVERRAPGTQGDDREIVMEGAHVRYEESSGYGNKDEQREAGAQNASELQLPKKLNTPNARMYFAMAIERQYMEPSVDGKYRWIGTGDRGVTSQLAYFLGRVYNYKNTISGNAGDDFPEDSLNELFGVKRLYSLLTQVYNAKDPQRWRSMIDAMFE
jgi:hypothetical protein